MNSLFARALTAIALGLFALNASAIVFDLAADWSDTNNPSGAWTYGVLSTSGTVVPFSLTVPNYINVGPPGFSGNQPAWTRCANTGNNGCPEGLARSTGIALAPLDFPAGRVGGHTPVAGSLAVMWTSPSDGVVDISGATWMWADYQGRRLVNSLLFNGSSIFGPVLIPTVAQGTTSATPFTFADSISASGGSVSSLSGVAVHAGDRFTWAVTEAPGSVEWFAGIDMIVNLSAVPEPSTLALGALGLAMVCVRRKRSTKSD